MIISVMTSNMCKWFHSIPFLTNALTTMMMTTAATAMATSTTPNKPSLSHFGLYFIYVLCRILVVTFLFAMCGVCVLGAFSPKHCSSAHAGYVGSAAAALIQLNYIFFVWFIFAIIYETVQQLNNLWNMDVLVQWTCHRFKLHHLRLRM